MISIDNLIIGGGISGTYLSSRQSILTPNETILLVDKMDNYGGNMINYKIPDTNIILEYGPIRFFPSIHPRVNYLVKKYNLHLTEYLPSSTNQILYLRNKSFTNDNVFPDSDSVYNIRPDEKFINPFETLKDNLKKYIKNTDDLYLFERRIELYKEPYLSNIKYKSLAQGNLSEENWKRINDMIGYDNLFELGGSFLPLALENLILTNKSANQYKFTNGYNILPITIASKNNIKTILYDDFNQDSFNCHNNLSLFNTVIVNIERDIDGDKWKVTIGKVIANTPEKINYTPVEIKQLYVRKIYSTIPVQFLSQIHNFPNYYNNLIFNKFEYITISRYFLIFEEDWLLQRGIGYGKTISTLDGGQFIHYDYKILQIYAINNLNYKFAGFIESLGQIQKEVIPPNNTNQPLIDALLESVKQTYGVDKIPKVVGISYCVWKNCAKFLTNCNLQSEKLTSLYETINNFMYPYGKKGNFYVIENAVSYNNAWVEGSLEMVDYLFKDLYEEPLFGETLIK